MESELPPFDRKQLIHNSIGNFKDYYTFQGQPLGEGSYGIVRMAIRKSDGAKRAVKLILKSRVKRHELLIREVSIMKQLDHPNIVKLFEIFEDRNYIYMVMELCEGGELFDMLIDTGVFTEEKAYKVVRQMLLAINYLHDQNIAHRDIKPENFLFATNRYNSPIKLIDFGFAKSMEIIGLNTKAGTAYYVSPEVLTGIYTVKCDIWSIGVIMFMLLSGTPPFDGSNDTEILDSVKRGRYSFSNQIWNIVSPEAKDLISKMLDPLPPRRPTAADCLQHSWFQIFEQTPVTPTLTIDLQPILAYQNYNKFKKAVISYIATQCSTSELQDLDKLFQRIDRNNDGQIGLAEFQEALINTNINQSEIEEIFNNINIGQSGQINYTEFLASTINHRIYLDSDKLLDAFQRIDTDNTGTISIDNLRSLLDTDNLVTNEEIWQQMVQELDVDADGNIDFDDFVQIMQLKTIECTSPVARRKLS